MSASASSGARTPPTPGILSARPQSPGRSEEDVWRWQAVATPGGEGGGPAPAPCPPATPTPGGAP